ncbi:hypothetical protein [Alcanivorax xiamenensis]|uniref:hypothetical protein n=1 Tax=Alcanivorax xiamenensis TaxID=1177156 RepID=UPI00135A5FE8|nr:hypothetical protein [Alcanivorax xiamenensis]
MMVKTALLFSVIALLSSPVQATRPPPGGGAWPVCDRLEMSFFIVASLRYEEDRSLEWVLKELDKENTESPEERGLFEKMVRRVYELPANPEYLTGEGEDVTAEALVGDILDECGQKFP